MADLQVLRGTSVTAIETFQTGAGPLDLDTGVPTVTALYPDGSALTPAPTATHVGAVGSGQYQIGLHAQPEVTELTLTWVGTIGGEQQTLRSRVEWTGDLLFTLAEAKAFQVAGSTPLASITDAKLMETRAAITDEFEAICGWSFIPRFRRDTFNGAWDQLILDRLKVQRVISLTVDGVAFTAPQLADLAILPGSVLRRRTLGWFASTYSAATVVEYVHGFDRVPGAIKQAALKLCAAKLTSSAIGSGVSSYSTPDGTTYSFDPAGRRIGFGDVQHYGLPAVDSCLNRSEYNAGTLAVA
jgi:hypothetical protein